MLDVGAKEIVKPSGSCGVKAYLGDGKKTWKNGFVPVKL